MSGRLPTPAMDLSGGDVLNDVLSTSRMVGVSDIRTDGGTQPRAGLDAKYVDALVEDIRAGALMPPIDVMYDGESYWLFDGFHRLAAQRKISGETAFRVSVRIHQGTLQDAQWASYAVNKGHGLRRTNEDKQRAIAAALKHPNGASRSDREIARHLGVDHTTVGEWRKRLESSGGIHQIEERTVERNGQTYTQKTTNIGSKPKAEPTVGKRYELRAMIDSINWENVRGDDGNRLAHLQDESNFDFYLAKVHKLFYRNVDADAVRAAIASLIDKRMAEMDAVERSQAAVAEYHASQQAAAEAHRDTGLAQPEPVLLPEKYSGLYLGCTVSSDGRYSLRTAGLLPGMISAHRFNDYRSVLEFLDEKIVDAEPAAVVDEDDDEAEAFAAADLPKAIPVADERLGRALRLIDIYNQAISTEDEYGELTGCFSETLGAKRELQKLTTRLQRLVDMLEGRAVRGAEECE